MIKRGIALMLLLGIILLPVALADNTKGSFTILSNDSVQPQPSGSGGGRGGAIPTQPPSQEKETCSNSWYCDDWGVCIGVFQARECTDQNQCANELKTEERLCVPREAEEFLERRTPFIPIPYWVAAFSLLLLLLIIIIILIKKLIEKKKRIIRIKKH